ncbi:MAG TPA: hypothetical protein VFP59_18040 [Candidatus Angelobacter sp.]|nr:hypothetical protein [Candidatus Angelobacter sp.]
MENPALGIWLKYSGLALPLIALVVWLAGTHRPITGPVSAGSPIIWRLILFHALLALTVFLQGVRYFYLLARKRAGGLLIAAGSAYAAMIVVFGFSALLK